MAESIIVNLTLARAFNARKELNVLIAKMRNNLECVRAYVREDEYESELTRLETRKFSDDVKELNRLLDTKVTVDIAIEQNNVEGQVKLAKIDRCNRLITLYERIDGIVRGAKQTDRFFNNVTGKYEVIELQKVIYDPEQYSKACEEVKQEKRKLEEDLQKFNNETEFPVSIDSDIAKKLGL